MYVVGAVCASIVLLLKVGRCLDLRGSVLRLPSTLCGCQALLLLAAASCPHLLFRRFAVVEVGDDVVTVVV